MLAVASSQFDSPRKITNLRGFTNRKEELDIGVVYIMRSSLMEHKNVSRMRSRLISLQDGHGKDYLTLQHSLEVKHLQHQTESIGKEKYSG